MIKIKILYMEFKADMTSHFESQTLPVRHKDIIYEVASPWAKWLVYGQVASPWALLWLSMGQSFKNIVPLYIYIQQENEG